MYKVITAFTDLQDKGYSYAVGDDFPRHGVKVSPRRLAELAGSENKRHTPLIEEVVVKAEKPVEVAVAKKPNSRKAKN